MPTYYAQPPQTKWRPQDCLSGRLRLRNTEDAPSVPKSGATFFGEARELLMAANRSRPFAPEGACICPPSVITTRSVSCIRVLARREEDKGVAENERLRERARARERVVIVSTPVRLHHTASANKSTLPSPHTCS